MNISRAIALSIPVLVTALSMPPASAQTVNISQLQTNFQAAVCSNNWNQALRAIAPLIGSPGISAAYRQELVQFRPRLQDWRAARAEFVNVPGCEGVIPILSPAPSSAPRRPLNWQRAIDGLQRQPTNDQ